jgi:hypothetical protein
LLSFLELNSLEVINEWKQKCTVHPSDGVKCKISFYYSFHQLYMQTAWFMNKQDNRWMLVSLTLPLSRMDLDTFNKIEGTTNTVETSHVQRNMSGIKHSLAIAISLFVVSALIVWSYTQFYCPRAYEEDVIVALQIKYGYETGNFTNDSNGISIRTIQNQRRHERKRTHLILNSSLSDDLVVFEEQIRELEKQIEYSKNDVRDVLDTNTKKQAAREQKEWRDQIKAIKGSEEYKAAKKASKGRWPSCLLKFSYIFCPLNSL